MLIFCHSPWILVLLYVSYYNFFLFAVCFLSFLVVLLSILCVIVIVIIIFQLRNREKKKPIHLLDWYHYSSQQCQKSHWNSGHKTECKVGATPKPELVSKSSAVGGKNFSGIALVPARGISKVIKKPRKVYV